MNHRIVAEITVFVNLQMLDAILSSIIILFQEEFAQNGLTVSFQTTSKFTLSLITKVTASASPKRKNGLTVIDAKIASIHNIVSKIYDLCFITLQILNKDGNLVVSFSFEEH